MSNVRMMKKGDEADVNVSWEDQEKINTFSKLNAKIYRLEAERNKFEKEKEDLEEVIQELELADEEEFIKYRRGDAFFNFSVSHTQELCQSALDQLLTDFETTKSQIQTISLTMDEIKSHLYARFGNSINLERE
ncbi:hypothetical protein HMI54_001362 [Coelomomyces lativittatus]|nr:hypothetical protein HMI55_004114 [Coelomomyces lativittatus]KAJ1500012.1 hypothetical protein HMI56_004080 [Coelomomyces lativittatus]KAJ1510741.1 hypothetical protein HMI54_001362 [Coelomomyces lativittatus]